MSRSAWIIQKDAIWCKSCKKRRLSSNTKHFLAKSRRRLLQRITFARKKRQVFTLQKILDAYQLLCISHVRATVAEEIKKEIRDAIHANVIARKSEEFRDEIRTSMEKEILQKVEERIREEKTRLEKIMVPREGKYYL